MKDFAGDWSGTTCHSIRTSLHRLDCTKVSIIEIISLRLRKLGKKLDSISLLIIAVINLGSDAYTSQKYFQASAHITHLAAVRH